MGLAFVEKRVGVLDIGGRGRGGVNRSESERDLLLVEDALHLWQLNNKRKGLWQGKKE